MLLKDYYFPILDLYFYSIKFTSIFKDYFIIFNLVMINTKFHLLAKIRFTQTTIDLPRTYRHFKVLN